VVPEDPAPSGTTDEGARRRNAAALERIFFDVWLRMPKRLVRASSSGLRHGRGDRWRRGRGMRQRSNAGGVGGEWRSVGPVGHVGRATRRRRVGGVAGLAWTRRPPGTRDEWSCIATSGSPAADAAPSPSGQTAAVRPSLVTGGPPGSDHAQRRHPHRAVITRTPMGDLTGYYPRFRSLTRRRLMGSAVVAVGIRSCAAGSRCGRAGPGTPRYRTAPNSMRRRVRRSRFRSRRSRILRRWP
jgi:hypothetical protein